MCSSWDCLYERISCGSHDRRVGPSAPRRFAKIADASKSRRGHRSKLASVPVFVVYIRFSKTFGGLGLWDPNGLVLSNVRGFVDRELLARLRTYFGIPSICETSSLGVLE